MKKALCIIMLTAAFAASFFMRDYNIENRIWHKQPEALHVHH